jgi:hypothetical protein
MEKYCDQLVIHCMNILQASPQMQKTAKKGFDEHGRGFIPVVFNTAKDAMDMVKHFREFAVVRMNMHYLQMDAAERLDCAELCELVNEYDPKTECVCMLSISWGTGDTGENSSMKPFIIHA